MQLQEEMLLLWPKEIVELKKFPLQYIIKALALNVFWQRFQRATQKCLRAKQKKKKISLIRNYW